MVQNDTKEAIVRGLATIKKWMEGMVGVGNLVNT